jgi:hypothetical protein
MNAMKGSMFRRALRYSLWGVVTCGLVFVLGCNVQGVTSASLGISVNLSTHTIKIVPVFDPAGSDVASLDPSQALINIAMTNATTTTTSGTLTVTVTNPSTGATLGQQSFGYVVNGSAIYAQNPTAVHNWLQQFATYANVTVTVATDDIPEQDIGTSGTASVTASAQYQGTTYATAYKAWPVGSSGTGCGTGHAICIEQ